MPPRRAAKAVDTADRKRKASPAEKSSSRKRMEDTSSKKAATTKKAAPAAKKAPASKKKSADATPAAAEEKLDKREYGTKKYWDERYIAQLQEEEAKKGDKKKEEELDITADWLYTYADLEPLLTDCTSKKRKADVLDVGCGTSFLLSDMQKDKWSGKLCGFDISGIEEAMKMGCAASSASSAKSKILLEELDIRNASAHYGKNSFDLIIDKSTMDAILCAGKEGVKILKAGIKEISSMLRYNGAFVLITWRGLESGGTWLEHVLQSLLDGSSKEEPAAFAVAAHHSTNVEGMPWVYMFTKKKSKVSQILDVELHEH